MEMQELFNEGARLDGRGPDEHDNEAPSASSRQHQAHTGCQDGAVADEWQTRNLPTSLYKVLRNLCRIWYSNGDSLHARLWCGVHPLLVPAI